jgi:hypothetical protein
VKERNRPFFGNAIISIPTFSIKWDEPLCSNAHLWIAIIYD